MREVQLWEGYLQKRFRGRGRGWRPLWCVRARHAGQLPGGSGHGQGSRALAGQPHIAALGRLQPGVEAPTRLQCVHCCLGRTLQRTCCPVSTKPAASASLPAVAVPRLSEPSWSDSPDCASAYMHVAGPFWPASRCISAAVCNDPAAVQSPCSRKEGGLPALADRSGVAEPYACLATRLA